MNNTFYADCVYIGGADGSSYMPGHSYHMEISQKYWGRYITAVPVHGYEHKTIEDMRCYFDNLYYFLQCFRIERTVNGPNNWRSDREDYYANR